MLVKQVELELVFELVFVFVVTVVLIAAEAGWWSCMDNLTEEAESKTEYD